MAAIDIDTVTAVIREVAATEIMPRWRNLGADDVTTKSNPRDLVTVADRAAENALAIRLRDVLPGSVVIGEEGVHANPAVLEAFKGDAPVWVLDPIDGTRAFVEGRTDFDVMVALVRAGRPLAGWIYAPAEDDLIAGEIGAGVRRAEAGHGAVVLERRPPPFDLSEMQGIVTPQYFLNRRLSSPELQRARFKGYTRHICAGHNYARLLRGEADFLINFTTHPWDHFPGTALAEAAGMQVRRHDGHALAALDPTGGVLVAPDPASWAAILALLLPRS